MIAPAARIPGFKGLRAHGLSLSRGERTLFHDLSFELGAGELFWLTGANGSGKSSLLRALIGLATLRSGSCEVLTDAKQTARPADRGSAPVHVRALSLYQGHAAAVKGELTAAENLRLMHALDGPIEDSPMSHATLPDAPDDHRGALTQALRTVGLERQRDIEARRLSQGQRQRLQLARFALGLGRADRPLWLMDEPSAALDDAGTRLLQDLLSAHLDRGGSAIVATHLPLKVSAGQCRALNLSQQPASPSAHARSEPSEESRA